MGKVLDLTFYNPAQLKDEDFLRGFVARRDLFEKIMARLGEIKLRGLAQHRLILGQRGMGKTSLLRRVALGIRQSPALSAVLLPLTFREEQYNVHNLHVFWCNCLDALGDWFEAAGQKDQAQRVDGDVAALEVRTDDEEGSRARDAFRTWMKREGKRPLLLLDNIDLIFDGLKDKQWSLRRVLQEPGGIVVVGATVTFMEASNKPDAPFYDFFQIDVLGKLSHAETVSCLRKLAAERSEAGQKVLGLLDRDPARIRALYDLTGGNPRTLAMLYLILEMSDDGDLMRDLERLLDQATPLYKARVEEFATQARVVFDAVALAWNPIIAADVAAVTGLETGAVSTQLDRLHRDGIFEKTSLSSSVRTGFQVSERFFNIWYLMRHAPRRQRNRLRWLTEFLRNFYTPTELAEMACGTIRHSGNDLLTRGTYCLALSDAVDDEGLRDALRSEAKQDIERYATEKGVPVDSVAESAALYRQALKIGESRGAGASPDAEAVPAANLAYLLLGQKERRAEAETFYERTIGQLPACGAGLLRAYRELVDDNFGAATTALKGVLEESSPDLFSSFRDDMLRVFRLAAARGYGERLLTWLDETGLKDRYWPFCAAFDAYVHGEERLQDVNPEVRGAAQQIFRWFAKEPKSVTSAAPAKPRPRKQQNAKHQPSTGNSDDTKNTSS